MEQNRDRQPCLQLLLHFRNYVSGVVLTDGALPASSIYHSRTLWCHPSGTSHQDNMQVFHGYTLGEETPSGGHDKLPHLCTCDWLLPFHVHMCWQNIGSKAHSPLLPCKHAAGWKGCGAPYLSIYIWSALLPNSLGYASSGYPICTWLSTTTG